MAIRLAVVACAILAASAGSGCADDGTDDGADDGARGDGARAREAGDEPRELPEGGADGASGGRSDAARPSGDSGSERSLDAGASPSDAGGGPNDASVGVDSGVTPTPDAASDGSEPHDASSAHDAGEPDPFGGCPTSADYVGNPAWTHRVVVQQGAIYCGRFNETRTLVEELATKAQLRIAPGEYRLPESGSGHPFALPLCVLLPDGSRLIPGQGTARYAAGPAQHQHAFEQSTAGASTRRLQGRLNFADTADAIVLDGAENDQLGDAFFSFTLCDTQDECFSLQAVQFDSCDHAGATLHRHAVGFAGGSVELDLRIGESFAGTEPGAFARATGVFMGTAFATSAYFSLVYNPEHHHFVRDFAVLFDAPIGDTCGLEVGGLEPAYGGGGPEDQTPDFAYRVDCALGRIAPLTVSGHQHSLP